MVHRALYVQCTLYHHLSVFVGFKVATCKFEAEATIYLECVGGKMLLQRKTIMCMRTDFNCLDVRESSLFEYLLFSKANWFSDQHPFFSIYEEDGF